VKGGLVLHPGDGHIIYPLGSTVVIRSVEDASDQTFLQGAPLALHPRPTACARAPL